MLRRSKCPMPHAPHNRDMRDTHDSRAPHWSRCVWFLLMGIAVFSAIWIPSPLASACQHTLESCAAGVSSIVLKGTVDFAAPRATPGSTADRAVRFTPAGSPRRLNVPLDIRRVALLPAALLIALVLATPLGWRRVAWAGALSVVPLVLFVTLRVLIALWWTGSTNTAVQFFSFSPPTSRLLQTARDIFLEAPTSEFLFASITWVATTFRAGDWSLVALPMFAPREKPKHKRFGTSKSK